MRAFRLAFLLSSLATVGTAAAQDFEPLSLKFAHFAPSAWAASQLDLEFTKIVEEKTDGQVKTEVFWAGALGKPDEILSLTAEKAVDFGATSLGYTPSVSLLGSLLQGVPGIFETPEEAKAVYDHVVRSNEALLGEYRKNKIYPVVQHTLNSYRLQCTRPVRTVADLKGLRVRSFGNIVPVLFAAFEITPVTLNGLGDVYEALNRGTIDCAFFHNELAASLKFQEVAKHWSSINFGANTGYNFFVSWDNWHTDWPRDLIPVLEAAADEIEAKDLANAIANEAAAIELLKQAGGEYIEFEEQELFNQKLPDTLDVWVELAKAQGLEAEAISIANDIREQRAAFRSRQSN